MDFIKLNEDAQMLAMTRIDIPGIFASVSGALGELVSSWISFVCHGRSQIL